MVPDEARRRLLRTPHRGVALRLAWCYTLSAMAKNTAAVLTAELETALLRELRSEWNEINSTYFRSCMVPPVLLLSESGSRLGQWHAGTRTISLSRAMVLQQPWGVVVEVFKHEVAHQYVHEVLAIHDETAHGPAFRDVCQRLGIDPAAAGLPEAKGEEQRILGRISRLLALAESDNVHEAEAAMAEAQRLMLKYNLEGGALESRPGYGFRHVGPVLTRINRVDQAVAVLLSEHFFVEVIWVQSYLPLLAKWGRVLEICGTPANLEMAVYVHGFLHQTAERLWQHHRRAQALSGNRDRRSFLLGVIRGFGDKLRRQQRQNREEGLVWLGDPDLARYLRGRHPRIRKSYGRTAELSAAYLHGKEAGRGIVLHKPVTQGPSRGPALLTGKS